MESKECQACVSVYLLSLPLIVVVRKGQLRMEQLSLYHLIGKKIEYKHQR